MTPRDSRQAAPVQEHHFPLTPEQQRDLQEQLQRALRRFERARAAGDDVERDIDAVTAALQRITDDGYGTCDTCGGPIPYGRLLVIPETTHCVGCRR